MKKPLVTLENYNQVYDFYQHYYPSKVANRIGHAAMALVYKPDVHYADGAEDAVGSLLQSDARLVLASNHVNDQDQYIVASMAQRESVMHPMRGKTFIPAKASLFRQSSVPKRLLRWGVDTMGAIPTFRQNDVADLSGDADMIRLTQTSATAALLDLSTERIARGDHMAIFPEGTRNTVDPRRVQAVKPGLGRIVCKLEDDLQVAIVPTGLFYGEGADFDQKRPTVFVGQPFEAYRDPVVLTAHMQTSLQECVDQAIKIRTEG